MTFAWVKVLVIAVMEGVGRELPEEESAGFPDAWCVSKGEQRLSQKYGPKFLQG